MNFVEQLTTEQFWNVLSLIGFLVTVVGVGLTIWQFSLAKNQVKDLNEIKTSISTRYLGKFAEFVPDINQIINEAKREIIICCDFPAYSFYTSNSDWRAYRNALDEKIAKGVKVELSVPNEAQRKIINIESVAFSEKEWSDWKLQPNHYDAIQSLISSNKVNSTPEDLDKEKFLELIELQDKHMLSHTFGRAKVIELDFVTNILFWIVDERVAVFSFASLSQDVTEHGFITYDKNLMSSLRDIRNRYNKTKV